MGTLSIENEKLIKRASNRAALLTVFGAIVIVGALAYSASQLNTLNGQIELKRQDLVELKESMETLAEQKDELESANIKLTDTKSKLAKDIANLKLQRDYLDQYATASYRQVELAKQLRDRTFAVVKQSGPADDAIQKNIDEIISKAPIETVVQPSATATRVPDNPKLYDFKLNLKVPTARKQEIEKVTYFFDHPSFTRQKKSSTDSADDYPVGYRGWGALHRVIITLHLRNGKTADLAFDMSKAVNKSVPGKGIGRINVPSKGEIPTKGDSNNKIPTKGDSTEEIPTKGDSTEEIPTKGGQ